MKKNVRFNEKGCIEVIQKYVDGWDKKANELNPHKPFYKPMMIIRSKWNPFYWLKGKHKIVWACNPTDLIN